MIMAQKTSRSKSRSKSKSGGRRERRKSSRGRSGPFGKNSKGEGAASGRKDEPECQLNTIVILELGSISKSTAEDIKKWIESFGAVESEEIKSEKLMVIGKVDTKRMREMVLGKAKAKHKDKINVEKSHREAGGLGKDDSQNEKNNGEILKDEVETDDRREIQKEGGRSGKEDDRRKIQKEGGRSGKDDDRQNKENNGKTRGEEDRDLDTVVVLNLGLNSKSFGADIQKWIRSFGAVESEDCMSGKLTVTGRVDAKRLGVMLSMMASNTDVPGSSEAGLATHAKLPKNPEDINS